MLFKVGGPEEILLPLELVDVDAGPAAEDDWFDVPDEAACRFGAIIVLELMLDKILFPGRYVCMLVGFRCRWKESL